MPVPMIIDTDTASDDAVALIMALRAPEVEVKAITIVAGNVNVQQGSRNARYTVELCDADVPVYEGAAHPLVREPSRASFFHGQDGLGDRGYPEPSRPASEGDAVSVLIETIRAHPGLVVVTLGPLTNLALALEREPDIARCRALDTPRAHFAIDTNTKALEANRALFHDPGIGLPDPVAMAVALDPEVVTRKSRHAVDVECEGTLTRGMTVVDELDVVPRGLGDSAGWRPAAVEGTQKATVCWEIDAQRFKERLFRALA